MTAVLFQQPTDEIEAWLAERQRAGLDIRDEVWEGTYVVMNPSPSVHHAMLVSRMTQMFLAPAEAKGLRAVGSVNVGQKDDYRIPDVTVIDVADADPSGNWLTTAAIAVEIRSPGEAHEAKLPFYAKHDVNEVVLVEPVDRTVRWLALRGGTYHDTDRSDVFGLRVASVIDKMRWE